MVDSLRPGTFTLDHFRRLLDQAQRSARRSKAMAPMLGVSNSEETVERETQEELNRIKGIIDSMTPEERRDPEGVLDESRLARIAVGAGVEPREVRALARQFHGMAEIMEQLTRRRPRRDWLG